MSESTAIKITLNLSAADQQRIDRICSAFPFAKVHAVALLALREGLDVPPEQLVARLQREREQETAA